MQQIQRSHSHSQPDSNGDPSSEGFNRSSSVPRCGAYDGQDEEMESEPFEIQNLSPSRKLLEVCQTMGEVTSDNGIEDDERRDQNAYVSTVV